MFSLISNTAINQQQQQLGIGDAVHDQTRSFISCRLQIEMLVKQNHPGRIAQKRRDYQLDDAYSCQVCSDLSLFLIKFKNL